MIRRPTEELPKSNPSPEVGAFLPATIILIVLGGAGFAATVLYTTPSGGTRWAFYFTAVLALTGLALPVMAYFNRRFPSIPPVTGGIVLRQAIWVGIYIPTLAWLQSWRLLSPMLALVLGIGLTVVEGLLRMRERAQWDPESNT